MTPEEKVAHENGIRLMNQMSGSIFSYTPIITDRKCADCFGKADHYESMKHDEQYKRLVCTPCRDKLIWKSYKRWLKKHGSGMAEPTGLVQL